MLECMFIKGLHTVCKWLFTIVKLKRQITHTEMEKNKKWAHKPQTKVKRKMKHKSKARVYKMKKYKDKEKEAESA